jgi:hypothetical protein
MVNAEFCLRNCRGNRIFGYREPPREPPYFRFWSVPAFRNRRNRRFFSREPPLRRQLRSPVKYFLFLELSTPVVRRSASIKSSRA